MVESAGGHGVAHVHVGDGQDARSANLRRLTDRQLDVLRLRAKGMTNLEVAGRLGVSLQTVKNHQADIHERLKVESLVGAMNALGWVKVR